MRGILEEVAEKGERRNVYMNLAYTGPIDNTTLQEEISFEKVDNTAANMFLDTARVGPAQSTEASSTAATAEDDDEKDGPIQKSLSGDLEGIGKRPLRIPSAVERGYEIPICVTDPTVVPEI